MRKIRVNFIVVLVVVAMCALLLIQAFQTVQLYEKKAAQFKEKVATTLERIAVRHEKAEDVRKFFQVANTDFSGEYKDILKEEFQNLLAVEESISIKDTSFMENGKLANYLVIKGQSFDSISGLTTEQRVLAKDVRQLRDFYKTKPAKDSADIAIQLDKMVIRRMFERAKFVNKMMQDAFRINVFESPENRFDIVFLDSVIKTEFQDDNLPDNYQFLVQNEEKECVKFLQKLPHCCTQLDTTKTFTTSLFPTKLFGEEMRLHVYFPDRKSFLLQEMGLPLLVNFLLMFIIVGALIFMFRTILSQKKLAELKNDFISNMTHEFKTPISTISLACQALDDPDIASENGEEKSSFVKMISDENKRLGVLVEKVLQSASLDKKEVELNKEKVLLNELIHDIVSNATFRRKEATIDLKLTNELVYITADKMHLTNVISNLVDNALKYSDGTPDITIYLEKTKDTVQFAVEDKGLGIKKEHLDKIFDKLYRIPTGNVHNVKGFGLGLSYVKAIVDLHDWTIDVKSKYGEGSTFTLKMNNKL